MCFVNSNIPDHGPGGIAQCIREHPVMYACNPPQHKTGAGGACPPRDPHLQRCDASPPTGAEPVPGDEASMAALAAAAAAAAAGEAGAAAPSENGAPPADGAAAAGDAGLVKAEGAEGAPAVEGSAIDEAETTPADDGMEGALDGEEAPPVKGPTVQYTRVMVPKTTTKLHVVVGQLPEELSTLKSMYFLRDRPGKLSIEEIEEAVEIGVLNEGPGLRILEQVSRARGVGLTQVMKEGLVIQEQGPQDDVVGGDLSAE